jgi:glycine reductase
LKEDKRLSHIEIELTRPGEKCRIIKVADIVEPRAKKNGGVDFPGALEKQGKVGQGTTCVLRGTAVVLSEFTRPEDIPKVPSMPQYGELIDMSGPGAELSIYGRTHNITLVPWPATGISLGDYRIALKIAGLKTAVYLAQAGKNLEPDEIEVYDLPPLSMIPKGFDTLPKVAYVFQIISGQFVSIPGYPILYGSGAERIAPTILHPNEVLDGAIVTPYRSMGMDVFSLQNHSIIKELYRRHGKDLCFMGVVITVAHDNLQENERAATMVAHLAKWILGADGVILTKSGGGIPEVAMALTAQRCEELGVRTSLALVHYPTVLSGGDSTTLFNVPEVDAIVSLGTPYTPITLPSVERVIGRPMDLREEPLVGREIKSTLNAIRGALSQIGNSRFKAVQN